MSLTIRPVDPGTTTRWTCSRTCTRAAAPVPRRVCSRARGSRADGGAPRPPVSRTRRADGRPDLGGRAARSTTCTWRTSGPGCRPRFGRRGHGTALVGYAEQHVRDLGRRTAVTQTWIGATATAATGRSPSASATRWPRPRSSAGSGCPWTRRRWPGSRRRPPAQASVPLHTVLGPIPAELVPGFLDLYNLMNVEMPTGEIELEEGAAHPEVQAQQDEELRDQGRTRLTVWRSPPTARRSPTPTWSPVPPTATTPGSTSGRRSCAPTTAVTGSAWPSSAR